MRRLLLIEDEADTASLLGELLEVAGYAVTTMEHASDATAALERSAYDLVISDLRLDAMNLDECWAAIAGFVDLAGSVPVGLLTGWNVTTEQARQHGAAFVIRKPCSSARLFAAIGDALGLPAPDEALVARVRAYFAAIEHATFDTLGTLCTEDVVYRVPGTNPRFSTEVRGRSEFVRFARETFEGFSEPQFELRAIRPLPNGALVEYIGTWRDGTERRDMPGAVIFAERDGKFSRIEVRVAADELR